MNLICSVLFHTVVLSFFLLMASSTTNETTSDTSAKTHTIIPNQTNVSAIVNSTKISHDVLIEGGGKVSLPSSSSNKSTQSPSANNSTTNTKQIVLTTHQGREGYSTTSKQSTAVENVSKAAHKLNASTSKLVSAGTTLLNETTQRSIPIYEPSDNPSNATKPRKIFARKGVDEKNTISSVSNVTKSNVTVSVNSTVSLTKKPLVTIPGEDEPYAPSHFRTSKKGNQTSSDTPLNQVPLDVGVVNSGGSSYPESTQKYIFPIVVLILSVPFVAILISIVYKRGTEWWRYRHYRRMDFLINGMYDN